MVDRADVVVVGGGILGCAAAWELLQAGVGEVLVVDRDGVADATSNAGGGFVALWGGIGLPFWGSDEVALERHGIEFYRRLAEEDNSFGFKQNGTLWPATNEQAWQFVGRIAESPLMDTEVLDGKEVAALTGVADPDHVRGAVFQPDGCELRAGDATRALARRFERAGGRIDTRRPVTGLRTSGGRVVGVDTQWGPIDAGTVVLAAGAWTNHLLAGVDRWAPAVPLVASRMTTGPLGIPSSMPSMMWAEFSGMWVREESGGLVWGATYTAAPHFSLARRPVPGRFDQLPLDGVQEVQRLGTLAAKPLPPLGKPMSITVAHGAPCFTPDKVGVVGPVPDVADLWVIAGCNEGGITHGPGYAKVVADVMTSGATALVDHSRLAFDRFGDRFASYEDVAEAVCSEQQSQRAAAGDGLAPGAFE